MGKFGGVLLLSVMFLAFVVVDNVLAEDASQVSIIANKDIGISSVQAKDIKGVFLGKQTKIDGAKVVIVLLKKGDANDIFLKTYIGKTAKQFSSYWKKRVFSGKSRMPKSFKTGKEVAEYVASKKNTIAYIASSLAQDATIKESIKILSVEK